MATFTITSWKTSSVRTRSTSPRSGTKWSSLSMWQLFEGTPINTLLWMRSTKPTLPGTSLSWPCLLISSAWWVFHRIGKRERCKMKSPELNHIPSRPIARAGQQNWNTQGTWVRPTRKGFQTLVSDYRQGRCQWRNWSWIVSIPQGGASHITLDHSPMKGKSLDEFMFHHEYAISANQPAIAWTPWRDLKTHGQQFFEISQSACPDSPQAKFSKKNRLNYDLFHSSDIRWNFEKILVGRNGKASKRVV